MKHASLLNPFNLNQEPSKLNKVKFVGRQASRSTPVCSNCQSDDIIGSAKIQWSNESQDWELASTFGQPTHCNNCKAACDIFWRPLN